MAQAVTGLDRSVWIDRLLASIEGAYEGIAAVAAAWSTWTSDEQLDYEINWGPTRVSQRTLDELAAQGLLSPEQRQRYDRLQALIAQHGPTLEKLLAD